MALNIKAVIIRRHKVISAIIERGRKIGGLKSGRGKSNRSWRVNLSWSSNTHVSLGTVGRRTFGWGTSVERDEFGDGVGAKAAKGRCLGASDGSSTGSRNWERPGWTGAGNGRAGTTGWRIVGEAAIVDVAGEGFDAVGARWRRVVGVGGAAVPGQGVEGVLDIGAVRRRRG